MYVLHSLHKKGSFPLRNFIFCAVTVVKELFLQFTKADIKELHIHILPDFVKLILVKNLNQSNFSTLPRSARL